MKRRKQRVWRFRHLRHPISRWRFLREARYIASVVLTPTPEITAEVERLESEQAAERSADQVRRRNAIYVAHQMVTWGGLLTDFSQ